MTIDLGERLRQALGPRDLDLLRDVAESAETLHMPLYAVGGFPRDLILGRPAHDLDLVVEGDAVELARLLATTRGGSVKEHRRFGTAVWLRPRPDREARAQDGETGSGLTLDLATARTESYSQPAQLPQVRPGSIQDDLHRRDFTINALAVRLDGPQFGRVLDPLGGIDDIRRRLVRVLHAGSFVDDPTRMYRAVRYERRLGFHIDPGTIALLHEAGKWVRTVSGERLRGELEGILMEDMAGAMIKRLSKLGLLGKIHPKLPADSLSLRRLGASDPRRRAGRITQEASGEILERWSLWLMGLSPAALRSIGRRLAFGQKELQSILDAAELHRGAKTWIKWAPSRLTEKLDGMQPSALQAVLASRPPVRARRRLEQYLHSWRHVKPHLTGRDLKAMGLNPGPQYRSILRALRSAWIDGILRDDDDERLMLQQMMRGRGHRTGRIRIVRSLRSNIRK